MTEGVSTQDPVALTSLFGYSFGMADDPVAVRFCVACGSPKNPFPNATALKCTPCRVKTAEDRKVYFADYARARGRAERRLVKRHQAEFDSILEEERMRLEQEAKNPPA